MKLGVELVAVAAWSSCLAAADRATKDGPPVRDALLREAEPRPGA